MTLTCVISSSLASLTKSGCKVLPETSPQYRHSDYCHHACEQSETHLCNHVLDTCPRNRGHTELQMEVRGEPARRFVPLADFLLWLSAHGGEPCKVVTRSLICWVAWIIEGSDFVKQCSSDALLDAPVPMGRVRARRIDPSLKRALGEAVGSALEGGPSSASKPAPPTTRRACASKNT